MQITEVQNLVDILLPGYNVLEFKVEAQTLTVKAEAEEDGMIEILQVSLQKQGYAASQTPQDFSVADAP